MNRNAEILCTDIFGKEIKNISKNNFFNVLSLMLTLKMPSWPRIFSLFQKKWSLEVATGHRTVPSEMSPRLSAIK